MKKLVIAEKSSLARSIADGIRLLGEVLGKAEGYLESDSYIVTWCVGHLFELKDMEEYDPNYDKSRKISWKENFDKLPFYPEEFQFGHKKNDPGRMRQFRIIQKLHQREDVDSVINAGDSDREGEIIVRILLDQIRNRKPVYRLWMPDQTPVTIKYELTHMRPDSEYDNLARAGMARMYIDWLYGINLTRYVTIKSGACPPLKVGRVVTPIVKAVYDRDMQIKNFQSEKYLSIKSEEQTKGVPIILTSKHKYSPKQKKEADELCRRYNSVGAVVREIKKEEKAVPRPLLFSLSKVQGYLGKTDKISPETSLTIIQKLYEKGYLSYPRTNTEYLAEEEKGKVKVIIDILQKKRYSVAFRDSKKIFDNSKIESHSALIPTFKIPDMNFLDEMEKKVYMAILNRFLAVFVEEDCVVDRTTCLIAVGDMEEFQIRADMIKKKGWKEFDGDGEKNQYLPMLEKGDVIMVRFSSVEKQTSPPPHYTVSSLMEFLKNPFKEEIKNKDEENLEKDVRGEQDDREDYKAMFEGVELGTEATRTNIIAGAVRSGFMELKNNSYLIRPYGCYLVETLEKLHVKMDKENSVILSCHLKKVYRGESTIPEIVEAVKVEINEIFAQKTGCEIERFSDEKVKVGNCPKCGSDVYKGKKSGSYYCGNKECSFIMTPFRKKALTEKQAGVILKGEKVLLRGLKGEKGDYDIYIQKAGLKKFSIDEKEFWSIQFKTFFPNKKKARLEQKL